MNTLAEIKEYLVTEILAIEDQFYDETKNHSYLLGRQETLHEINLLLNELEEVKNNDN